MNPLFSAASPRARRATATLALLGLATVALAGAAQAAAIAGPGGTAEQGRRQVAFTDAPGSVPTPVPSPTQAPTQAPTPAPSPGTAAPELVSARIDAVDADGRSITVRGKAVLLHGQQLRVLAPGGGALAGARSLRAGMQVRFGLEPEARPAPGATGAAAAAPPAERRIVLIYVDSLP